MRLIPVLFIVAVVAFAGCTKSNPPPTDTTTTTTTTPTTSTTTSTTPTGSSTTTSTPTTTTTTPTTPTTPPPMDLCKPSFDYSTATPDQGNPGGFTPSKKACGTVAPGYTTFNLNGTFTFDTPVAVGQGIDVKLVGADGKTAVATCALSAGDMPSPVKCTKNGAVTAGDYSFIYDGGGAAKFAGTLSIS